MPPIKHNNVRHGMTGWQHFDTPCTHDKEDIGACDPCFAIRGNGTNQQNTLLWGNPCTTTTHWSKFIRLMQSQSWGYLHSVCPHLWAMRCVLHLLMQMSSPVRCSCSNHVGPAATSQLNAHRCAFFEIVVMACRFSADLLSVNPEYSRVN